MSILKRPLPVVYCEKGHCAELVRGDEIHGPTSHDKFFWFGEPCDAWTGAVESANFRALGILADKPLRRARAEVFAAFDSVVDHIASIHSTNRDHARRKAYGWLAEKMMLRKGDCDIYQFAEALCEQAEVFLRAYSTERKGVTA